MDLKKRNIVHVKLKELKVSSFEELSEYSEVSQLTLNQLDKKTLIAMKKKLKSILSESVNADV
jgi:hypothetical protein